MSTPTALVKVMIDATRKAARGLTRDFGELAELQVSKKGPADYVSAADTKAEQRAAETEPAPVVTAMPVPPIMSAMPVAVVFPTPVRERRGRGRNRRRSGEAKDARCLERGKSGHGWSPVFCRLVRRTTRCAF